MLPPYRSHLSSAIDGNRSNPYSRFFQLATVTPAGYPSNRTLVFRGFLEDDSNSLKIVIDVRSAKVQDIERQAVGEICWYFTETREQFRIQGVLRLVKAQDKDSDLLKARNIAWQELSDAARSQFAWSDPGQPAADQSTFDIEPPDPILPPDTFGLLLLVPQKVDHLKLRSDPHQRCIYQLETDTTWSSQWVNP